MQEMPASCLNLMGKSLLLESLCYKRMLIGESFKIMDEFFENDEWILLKK